MKKLLVTVIGAAVAYGASAGFISTQRFESASIGSTSLATLNGGNEWFDDNNSTTNTYKIESVGNSDYAQTASLGTPTKALAMKTKFGEPLSVNINNGGSATTIPNTGFYFDSMVKFTVCDEDPTTEYTDAKIVMWLQASEDESVTNVMVKAGYLTWGNNRVQVASKVYKCNSISDFGAFDIEKFHRVTIKAFDTITTANAVVPAFAIWIDSVGSNGKLVQVSGDDDARIDAAVISQLPLTEAANHLNLDTYKALFPSMKQTGSTADKQLSAVGFDGTGSITDISFTTDLSEVDEYAQDWVDPEIGLTINGTDYPSIKTLADAIAYINSGSVSDGAEIRLPLLKGITVNSPLVFAPTAADVNLVIDFNGCVITNAADNEGAAIKIGDFAFDQDDPTVEITDSLGTGGIRCLNAEGSALDLIESTAVVSITGGNFWGFVDFTDGILDISGGAFLDDSVSGAIVPEKKLSTVQDANGLYPVINKVNYTVKFISGEGSLTNEYVEVEGTVRAVPTPAAVVGKTFSAWDPAIAGATVTVTADATYTALYTNNIYTITFVIGESSSSVQKEYGSEITSVPEIPVRAGYTGAWDDDPAGDTVTGDKTYTYTYSAETYTITYKTAEGEAFTAWADQYDAPASFTVEAPVTLPEAEKVALALGVTFNGWTNAVGTAVTTTEGLTADLVVFANVTVPGPSEPTIDPASSTTVEVTASSKQDAINAVAIAAPAAAGIETAEAKAAYKALFDIDATNKGGDTWQVEIKDIKEQVKIDVAETAEAIVSGTAATGTVTVPKGLYYKVTTYTALGGAATLAVPTTLSNGAASSSIAKPGDVQGFIKVEMATTADELAD